jgi:hypothetical protein
MGISEMAVRGSLQRSPAPVLDLGVLQGASDGSDTDDEDGYTLDWADAEVWELGCSRCHSLLTRRAAKVHLIAVRQRATRLVPGRGEPARQQASSPAPHHVQLRRRGCTSDAVAVRSV